MMEILIMTMIAVLHRLVESNIPKKKFVNIVRAGGLQSLPSYGKASVKLSMLFQKGKTNEAKLEEIRNMFKDEVFKASDEYLDEMELCSQQKKKMGVCQCQMRKCSQR